MLTIRNLHVSVNNNIILKGVNLAVNKGEVHAIMGPNGSGKSTLAAVLTGNETYEVDQGEVRFKGKNLLEMDVELRAKEGLFLGFQYPVEIPGVTMMNFLKTAVNEHRKHKDLPLLKAGEFLKLIKKKKKIIGMDSTLTNRGVNDGFSGGEKKKNEIFQMAVLKPCLAILDETDSGLDIDALKIVAQGVNRLRDKNNAIIIITHYQRLLEHIVPDIVHVFHDGKIIKTSGKELALQLEKEGYSWIKK